MQSTYKRLKMRKKLCPISAFSSIEEMILEVMCCLDKEVAATTATNTTTNTGKVKCTHTLTSITTLNNSFQAINLH